MSKQFKILTCTLYECKYHIVLVFCPKYQFRIFDGKISEYTKQQIYKLCRQKELVEVIELKCTKGPYPCNNVDSTKIFSIVTDGTIKREIINNVISKIREIRQGVLGKTFVVTRLLC